MTLTFTNSPSMLQSQLPPKVTPSLSASSPQTTGNKGERVIKPKQSKSRNGCVTCKAKRLKCDEIKPSCQQCHKRNVTCGGYKKEFKWRAFEETTFITKPAPFSKAKKSPTSIEFSVGSPDSPGNSEASNSPLGNERHFRNSSYQIPSQPANFLGSSSQPFHNCPTSFAFGHSSYLFHQHAAPSSLYQDNFSSVSNPVTNKSQPEKATSTSYKPGQSPRLIDLLLPGTDLNVPPPEYMDYRPRQSNIPYQPGGNPHQNTTQQLENDVEEIIRQPDQQSGPSEEFFLSLSSPSPSNSSSSSEGSIFDSHSQMPEAMLHAHMQMHMIKHLHPQPKLLPGSPEALLPRFNEQTCGILSIKDGPTENPWRTMIWPLALETPALYHAISAMSALHSSKQWPEMAPQGLIHLNDSVRYFSLDSESMGIETSLATTLALTFAASWDKHNFNGNMHIRYGKELVKQVLRKYRANLPNSHDSERLRFLCNTWLYVNVIARLTSIDDDWDDFDINLPLLPYSRFIEVDPLLGSASTLFPLIGQVANLISKVRTSSANSPEILCQAKTLKAAVETWSPPPGVIPVFEDPTLEIHHSLQTADAYRWATLLYLHQAVPEIPSRSTAELALQVITCLKTVPLNSRAIIIQIFPLMAAGCEAVGEGRAWVENRWEMMIKRMKISNLEMCWEIVQEVWFLRDADQAEKSRQSHVSLMSQTVDKVRITSTKRKFKSDNDKYFSAWTDGCSMIKRRASPTYMAADYSLMTMECEPLEKPSVDILEDMDPERTVRGRLHWIGVMKARKWEVLLG